MDDFFSLQSVDARIALAIEQVNSITATDHLIGIISLRRLLSVESDAPIGVIVASGVLPRLVTLLQSDSHKLQFEAAWIITNIASGDADAVCALVDAGAVPVLVDLIRAPHEQVCEQAIWALGNIAADSVRWRDLVLSLDALPRILVHFTALTRESLLRTAAWTLSMFCRGSPALPVDVVNRSLIVLADLLRSEDPITVGSACWALANVSENGIQTLVDMGLFVQMLRLLQRSDDDLIRAPALRCVERVITNSFTPQIRIQEIIDGNFVPRLAEMLLVANKGAVSLFAAVISNGTRAQIGTLAMFSDVVQGLLSALVTSSALSVAALNCIEGLARGGSSTRTLQLLRRDANLCIVSCLTKLETLDNITDTMDGAFLRALFVLERDRLREICVALQALDLPALIGVTILDYTSVIAACVPMHRKWAVAVKTKHFRQ